METPQDKIFTPPLPAQTSPAVSVIIPLYNAEEYIGECLDSLLIQTFQYFEVIVVDDCSTDDSVAIVESYKEKFGGRLTFTKTEKNSGGGGYVPRNIGINLASGEYIQFLDADDLLLGTALEILHTAAKQYDAEVVYTGSYYDMKTPTDIYLCQDGEGIKLLKKGFEDKPYLRIDDRKGNLERLMVGGNNNLRGPWSKFIRRDFLIDNKILFPSQMKTSGDFIWTINVYCHAKRFLRLPISVYFYRRNIKSVTLTERESYKQVAYLVSVFVDFMSNLRTLENENAILLENSSYIQAALNSHFKWFLQRTKKARAELSDQEIYDALHREFAKDTSALTVPFFFSFIDNLNKANEEQTQTIKSLEKKSAQLQRASNYLPVSVIIPLYNAEKYIGKCLDSLLAQTFQNFEVIVVDDCSTDNGPVIVESYKEKFAGRLTLTKTEENSGGGGLPRNKGITLSRGEYIQFLDADDMLTKTALEELYTLAKDYNADVVNCEKFYHVDDDGTNIRAKSYQEGKFVSKPTFESEDLKKRVQNIIDDRYLTVPWNKFVRRDLITENEIFFPFLKTSEDNIWTQGLIFYGKKFLRVPNVVYIYCQSEGSSQRAKRTPQQHINFWLNPILLGLKSLDNLMSRHEFFKTNPSLRFAILKKLIDKRLEFTRPYALKLNEHLIYSAIKEEFGEKLGDYDVLISALCTALYDEKKTKTNDASRAKILSQFTLSDTARIDVKLEPKYMDKDDFKIISISDKKATVMKPDWYQVNGTGYQIQSTEGTMEIIAKAFADGKFSLNLKGLSVFDPNDKSKRIPYWVAYTKLTINNRQISDKLTLVWHDKPYNYKFEVKAGEEIKIQVEWLPYKSDAPISLTKKQAEPIISEKFLSYLTARVDVKLIPQDEGDFQILSVTDENATVKKARWLPKKEIGYVIQSYAGNMEIITKADANGQIQLDLRSMEIRNTENKRKRIPYWIDYTKLTVNGEILFDNPTSVWYSKPYHYTLEVKAGDEIKIQTEWLPHQSEAPKLPPPPPPVVIKEVEPIVEKFLPYLTSRVDVKLIPQDEGDFQILSVTDDKATVKKARWLPKKEIGYVIQSYAGNMEIITKADANGQIQLDLRSMEIRNTENKRKRVPYWIDYTKLTVNGEILFDNPTSVWYSKPYHYTLEVKAGDEIKIQTEWLPHRSDN